MADSLTPNKMLRALQRRADHLRRRINSSSETLSWDRREEHSLRWAIQMLTPLVKQEPKPLAGKEERGE